MRENARVDAYIEKSADFAKPILARIRSVVHEACPECEETIKWGMPHFMYHGILCSMAAFKAHCTLNFWKGALVVPVRKSAGPGMGQFGRIRTLSDLPARGTLKRYVKKAMAINTAGEGQAARTDHKVRKAVEVPAELKRALRRDSKALGRFERFSPSQQREYAEWIAGAKQDQTRERRLATALEWIAEGKPRNWKYVKR
jgi:uncharacterized protein YdeI (YjbR/CyaY-like superfamily)